VIDGHVEQLADHERRERAADHPQSLAEDAGKCRLGVGDALCGVRGQPPVGRRDEDGDVGEQERVADQACRQPGDETHAATAEVLVDDVGHHEHERPEQHAGGEVQRSPLTEQLPVERCDPDGGLEREDLDADELGDDGVGQEQARQHREQPPRSLVHRASLAGGALALLLPAS
jgi:hypothetical protein